MSLWDDFADHVFDGAGPAGFNSSGINCLPPFFCFPYVFFLYVDIVALWARVFGLIGCKSLSPSLAFPTSFNNNNNNRYVILISVFNNILFVW